MNIDQNTFTPFEPRQIEAYNAARLASVRQALCHAPSTNLYFDREGKMLACCYNRELVLGKYPQQTVMEALTGEPIQEMRRQITDSQLAFGCKYCTDQLQAGNISGLHASLYDKYLVPPISKIKHRLSRLARLGQKGVSLKEEWQFYKRKTAELFSKQSPLSTWITQQRADTAAGSPDENIHTPAFWPRCMEFELSNTCNLECAMCFGDFSSSIRKNREKRPPLESPYDAAFIDQLDVFLPHLWEAKFYGGEPFLIPLYYDIWDRMMAINPKITVHITTNGTVLNQKVKRLLEKLNVLLIVSIDSFDPKTYESIRVNADFDRVMENLAYFTDINRQHHRPMSIAVCPMILNWQEMPDIVDRCNQNGHTVYFNTVWYPLELSLRNMPAAMLAEVSACYEGFRPRHNNAVSRQNQTMFQGLLNQVKKWQEEAAAREQAVFGSQKLK